MKYCQAFSHPLAKSVESDDSLQIVKMCGAYGMVASTNKKIHLIYEPCHHLIETYIVIIKLVGHLQDMKLAQPTIPPLKHNSGMKIYSRKLN